MTKQKIKQLVKEYQKKYDIGEEEFGRADVAEFTQQNEEELDFACEEIEKIDDSYMIAYISGNVLTADKKWNEFVILTFDWEAIPDRLEKFDDLEDFVDQIYSLYEKAQQIRKGTFQFN